MVSKYHDFGAFFGLILKISQTFVFWGPKVLYMNGKLYPIPFRWYNVHGMLHQ